MAQLIKERKEKQIMETINQGGNDMWVFGGSISNLPK
jgi:hypothetical protein